MLRENYNNDGIIKEYKKLFEQLRNRAYGI